MDIVKEAFSYYGYKMGKIGRIRVWFPSPRAVIEWGWGISE